MTDESPKDLPIPGWIEARLEIATFLHAHPTVELMLFSQVPDARPGFRRQRPNIVTKNASSVAGRFQEAQQHADGSGLAGAVAAQQREHTAARHLQVQFIHGRVGAKVARQTASANNRLLIHCYGCLLSQSSTGTG